jgi:hypothetical protein
VYLPFLSKRARWPHVIALSYLIVVREGG